MNTERELLLVSSPAMKVSTASQMAAPGNQANQLQLQRSRRLETLGLLGSQTLGQVPKKKESTVNNPIRKT